MAPPGPSGGGGVSDAHLGTTPITGNSMPYSTKPMSLQLGTPTYGAERSVFFRYRLSGLDGDRIDAVTGSVANPSRPAAICRWWSASIG